MESITTRQDVAICELMLLEVYLNLRHHGVTEFATTNEKGFAGFGFARVWNPLAAAWLPSVSGNPLARPLSETIFRASCDCLRYVVSVCMRNFLLLLLAGALCAKTDCASAANVPPGDFPRFEAPGHEHEMETLRALFWLHYPGAGPKATLWDEWLTDPSLWPAVTNNNQAAQFRQQWNDVLSTRIIDPEGYVATHQHYSIAHQLGWPFPFWSQGKRGCGWHFSFKDTAPEGWRPHDLNQPTGWTLRGAADGGTNADGWRIEVTNSDAVITAPPWSADTFELPFLQLRWEYSGLGALQPCIEWTTPSATNFSAARRMYFEPAKPGTMTYTMVPMYRHPLWTGDIAQLRIHLDNSAPGTLTIQAFFSQYDTRHNINNQDFIRGCAKYFWWTGDYNFLRSNINRMRVALRFMMTEFHTMDRKVIDTTWVGHNGRSGLKRTANGRKEIIAGQGIGNNYWDILPFGGLDCYATVQYYDAVNTMARLEKEIAAHPEWNIPAGPLKLDPAFLEKHASEVRAEGNRLFWNSENGRFVACIDTAGEPHDYGFTFLNCEAIYYGFATAGHAREIMRWLNGDRIIKADTAQGPDIYHWRFGPRSTTRRNLDWYFWAWNSPESIPWGGQVQDGGAVLGFSYFDLMARLDTLGPDNAWNRLKAILKWFDEVEAAGGYRKYYNGQREGTLQGSGTPGGLGMDSEFFESAMLPQIMLKGFLGFSPLADGFKLNPRLPGDWPSLRVTQILFHDQTLSIRASADELFLERHGSSKAPLRVFLPAGKWRSMGTGGDGTQPSEQAGAEVFNWTGTNSVDLKK
ncbi:MAG TPA: glycosyl hydrolase family 65 protein [Verrucomicrobiae bacterium]|nr:glycosyl hydrolase family 65 protein [Verrucomicrobiae bacterium]